MTFAKMRKGADILCPCADMVGRIITAVVSHKRRSEDISEDICPELSAAG